MTLHPTSGPSNLPWNGGFASPPSVPEPDCASPADTDEKVDPGAAVLQNEDLLTVVFNHMAIDPTASDQDILQARKDLLSAVRVCNAFSEPALDALWRVLPSLTPLLKLLPSFGEQDGAYVVEDLREDDWERYDIHTRRVRVLYLKPCHPPVTYFVYLVLVQDRAIPLLPSLHELRILDNSSVDLTLASHVSTPELQVVEVHNNAIKDAAFFYPFLASLGTKHPNLRHLVLEGDRVVNLQPILTLGHLRKLELRLPNVYFSPNYLELLGNMESLVDLTLHAGSATPNVVSKSIRREPRHRVESTFTIESPSSKFKQVKHLHVLGTLPCIARVMEHMHLTSLTSFTLTELPDSANLPTHPDWMRSFKQLGHALFLEKIEINQLGKRPSAHDDLFLTARVLEPLLILPVVTSLIINNGSFVATTSNINEIALAFPSLQRLALPDLWHMSAPSPRALRKFSIACPKLEELHLCLNLNPTQNLQYALDLMTKGGKGIPHKHDHRLRKLYLNSSLGNLSNTQSIQFAKFLDRAFPNLEVLQGYGTQASNNYWSLVREVQAALQECRRNCS